MSVTFGSVGDIISVCILIKGLVKSLDDSRGSSSEYQAVIRELRSLDHALLEVELVFLSSQGSEELASLQETTLGIVAQCEKCITGYREKFKKYKRSLQDGGSGSFIRDSVMKLKWGPSEKEHLTKFRAEIVAHCLAVNMLVASAGVKATQINDENQRRLFKRVKQDQDRSSATQQATLEEIKTRIDENRTELQAARIDIETIGSGIGNFRQLGADILSLMQRIWSGNIITYPGNITLQSQLPRQLERTWTQEPVILKDPLGRVTPVHLEFVETYKIFQAVLEMRFDQLPGNRKVQRKEYALHADQSKQEIDTALAFRRWFRPGQHIDMSMVFNSFETQNTSCPGCKLQRSGTTDSEVKCQGCGMWYQRVEVEAEVRSPNLPINATSVVPPPGKRKREEDSESEDDPAHFCRVRLKCWKADPGILRRSPIHIGRTRRLKTQASRGDAVLIGFLGGNKLPAIATRAGEDPLDSPSHSETDNSAEDIKSSDRNSIVRKDQLVQAAEDAVSANGNVEKGITMTSKRRYKLYFHSI